MFLSSSISSINLVGYLDWSISAMAEKYFLASFCLENLNGASRRSYKCRVKEGTLSLLVVFIIYGIVTINFMFFLRPHGSNMRYFLPARFW